MNRPLVFVLALLTWAACVLAIALIDVSVAAATGDPGLWSTITGLAVLVLPVLAAAWVWRRLRGHHAAA